MQARGIIKSVESVEAPDFIWYEIGSALVKLMRRRLVATENEAADYLEKMKTIPVELVALDAKKTLALAIELKLSYYDASYVEVALRNKTELFSGDSYLCEQASNRVKTILLSKVEPEFFTGFK